jgi:hypothetical protein
LKRHKYDRTMRVLEALETFRAKTGAFTAGQPEQTLIWREGECWSRAMIDWLPDDPSAALWDLKTTGSHATESGWGRGAFDRGYDIQAAHYARGAELLRGEAPGDMHFAVIETSPPYAIRVFRLSPPALDIGAAKAAEARALWAECIGSGEWPAYPLDPAYIDPPAWVLRDWEWHRLSRPSGAGMRHISGPVSNVMDTIYRTGFGLAR